MRVNIHTIVYIETMSIYKRSLKIHISAVHEVNQFAISKARERIAWIYTSNHCTTLQFTKEGGTKVLPKGL